MLQQAYVFAVGVLALYCATSQGVTLRALAPIFGLLGQPVWLVTTYLDERWGMFSLALVYTLIWLKSLYSYRATYAEWVSRAFRV